MWSCDQKNHFFERWYWFKLNNLGLGLGMALKFYSSVAKSLKLKVRKFWGVIFPFVEVTGDIEVGVCLMSEGFKEFLFSSSVR